MKFIPSQLAYLTTDHEARMNLRALGKYLLFLAALVTVYAVGFHVIKLNVEHEQHSWVTGFYWTLVVMTTLGFGDVTFTSDTGRVFSMIVSRITHERNLEAIHRAGADFVLSYTTLGIEAVMSLLRGYPPVLLGEGVELFSVAVPASLVNRTLGDSGIGSATGLTVIALQQGERLVAPLASETRLPAGAEIFMLGSPDQRDAFIEAFGRG